MFQDLRYSLRIGMLAKRNWRFQSVTLSSPTRCGWDCSTQCKRTLKY